MRLLAFLLIFGLILYFFSIRNREYIPEEGSSKPRRPFRFKKNPREIWMQVYETASVEEARSLQARLEEEEVECVIYEQGKKDIHGNSLKGVGVAVPKTAAPHAQNVISRMPA